MKEKKLKLSWTEVRDEGVVHRTLIFDNSDDMLDVINQLKAQRNITINS